MQLAPKSKLQYSKQLAWFIFDKDIIFSFFICEGKVTYHSVTFKLAV
nr:MAG TPA: hypothetical protein [Caudoviricetes sp.]